ncbi:MAG: Pr6Pr family membrane protein [Eubacterium sp.]|nr:Pr6Pr family membrane protein [Eubacterium sp.]
MSSLAEKKLNPIAKNKVLGAFLIAVALIGFAIIVYRVSNYVFEYDPKHSPIDYGRWNFFTYFTVQSNIIAYLYFIVTGIAIFGNGKARRIAFNPGVQVLVTLYIIVAGLVYNSGFIFKLSPPLTFNTPYQSFITVMQCYFHMFMPAVVIVLLLFPFTNERVTKKAVFLSGIYPLLYSLFSIIRGPFTNPTYYPYPFYKTDFLWDTFMKGKPFNIVGAYAIMAVLLVVGISMFIAICAIIALVHNKRIKK